MTETCDRFEREWVDDPDHAAAREHLPACAACRAAAARYRRVAEMIEGAGATRPMPDGWDVRLLARLDADRRRRPRWIAPAAMAGVAAMAAAAALLLRRPEPAPAPPGQAVALAVRVEAGAGSQRASSMPRPGDRLAVDARAGRWRHAELRLYRSDRELVARCSDAPPCQRDGDRLSAMFPLGAAGRYRVLLIAGDAPAPAPAGAGLDADAAAVPPGAGELRIGEPIDVH
jgi:hypothetical protein